MKVNVSK